VLKKENVEPFLDFAGTRERLGAIAKGGDAAKAAARFTALILVIAERAAFHHSAPISGKSPNGQGRHYRAKVRFLFQ